MLFLNISIYLIVSIVVTIIVANVLYNAKKQNKKLSKWTITPFVIILLLCLPVTILVTIYGAIVSKKDKSTNGSN